jgi:hypothetical protein
MLPDSFHEFVIAVVSSEQLQVTASILCVTDQVTFYPDLSKKKLLGPSSCSWVNITLYTGSKSLLIWVILTSTKMVRTPPPPTAILGNRNSSVGRATGYGLEERGVGVRVPVWSRILFSPRLPDRLWGPPSLLAKGYRGIVPRVWRDRGVKLTTHLQLVLMSRKYGSIHPLLHTSLLRSA